MSREIVWNDGTGLHLVAVVRNQANQTWAGGNTFATRDNATVLAHPVALNELAATAQYEGDFPTTITTPDNYYYDIYEVANAGQITLLEVQAGPVAIGFLKWDGTAETTDGAAVLYGDNGSIHYTYTVYDTDGTTPLSGVAVKVSGENPAVHYSQTKITDALGKVEFQLNAGTVYFWRSRFDRGFTDPDIEVVS